MINTGLFTSNTCEWETPQEFFNKLNQQYKFTLDPCSDEFNHKCAKYFTKKEDGLSKTWANETVFCNPPYGKELYKWVEKAYNENKKNNVLVVMLLPARTDTRWFHNFIYNKAEIIFIKGRLKFGGSKNSAPFPSMLAIFNKEIL